jgi:hypothetical protein
MLCGSNFCPFPPCLRWINGYKTNMLPPTRWNVKLGCWVRLQSLNSDFSITFKSLLKTREVPCYSLFNFGSVLKHFSSPFKIHFCIYTCILCLAITMQLSIKSEAFLKHLTITYLERRTCTHTPCYALAHLLILSRSSAFQSHLSVEGPALLCNFGSILKHFSSTFQSFLYNHCIEGHVLYANLIQLWIISQAYLLRHIQTNSSYSFIAR